MLGQTVYINWPHLLEARVIGVSDFKNNICLKNFWQKCGTENLKTESLNEYQSIGFHKNLASIAES